MLVNFITNAAQTLVGSLDTKHVCDLFGGTGSVAAAFAPLVQHVSVNDVEAYSYVWIKHLLNGADEALYETYLERLNALTHTKEGLFCDLFSEHGSNARRYFTKDNALRIDTLRQELFHWEEEGVDDIAAHNACLASLLDATDRVANTASVYGAYLKSYKNTAKQPLYLRPLPSLHRKNASVYHDDGLNLLSKIDGDILYLDPPYNHRQYGLNYHVLNALVQYRHYNAKGKSGLGDYYRSKWCQRRYVQEELDTTLRQANFRYVLMSYSDEGLMNLETIQNIMKKYGRYEQVSQPHGRLRMQKSPKKQTIEYLHLLEKNDL